MMRRARLSPFPAVMCLSVGRNTERGGGLRSTGSPVSAADRSAWRETATKLAETSNEEFTAGHGAHPTWVVGGAQC
eukprot:scaffold5919_cov63-Phaeocystis_antarctica.AAC.1